MNPALVSIQAMRTMSNADLITAAGKFDRLSILETELVKRLSAFVQEETRKEERTAKFLSRVNAQPRRVETDMSAIENRVMAQYDEFRKAQVQGIVNWAKGLTPTGRVPSMPELQDFKKP